MENMSKNIRTDLKNKWIEVKSINVGIITEKTQQSYRIWITLKAHINYK